MGHSVTDARFAHAEGYTTVAFGRSGDFVCTGGSDSLVRVFYASKAERDQEAITLEQHSDNVLSLFASRTKLVSGDEEGMVYSFDLGAPASPGAGQLSAEPSGTVLRSTLPARDVSISGNERQVAIATDDEKITVVSLLDMALLHTLAGHRGSVNSVSYSPDSAYLASVGCNGTVRVWDMREDDPSCVSVTHKMAYVCEPGSSMEQSKSRWSPDGRHIAVPCGDHAIKLVERGSWEVAAELGGKHTKMITHVSWSANSKYIASVGLDSQAVVWDVGARKAIQSHTAANALCQVDWNPRGNILAFTDCLGALYIWDDVVPIEQGHAPPYERAAVAATAAAAAAAGASGVAQTAGAAGGGLVGDLFDDSAAVDGGAGNGMDVDDDDGDSVEDAGDALDDFVVDDDGAGYSERQAPHQWMATGGPQSHAFQPGSTPWIGNRRYLAFNMVGSVVSIAQDAAHNSIEVEFYDKSLYRDIHFSDSFKFAMAALSDTGCLFATTTKELANDHSLRGAGDASDVSVVSYRGFASWSTNADWMYKLPPKEHPRCIAASSHGAAVVTSQGMLRLLTGGGVQRHVESLPNRVVTCAARGDLLLLVLEALGTVKSTSGSRLIEYEYILMTMDGQARVASGACPLSPSGEIVWAGFSEEGHPATCDSKGMLRVLHRYWAGRDACWVPALDTRRLSRERGKREAFWPVALSAKQFIVVTCRDRARYPPFPRPILDELDVDIPLLNTDTHAGQQEAKYLTTRLFCEQEHGEVARTGGEHSGDTAAQARDDLEQDKLLLRLVQLACKADKAQRAIDLALMIKLDQSFDAAIKIAIHQKQTALAERLMRIRDSRAAASGGDGDGDGGDIDDHGNSENELHSVVAPDVRHRRRRPPAVTYGQKPSGGDGSDDHAANDTGGDSDASSGDGRPPLPPPQHARVGGMAGAAAEGGEARELVARPAQPPATSRPFNPFGVAAPNTSMEIRRSDSFFSAADLHSNTLSRESSAAASPAAAGKRQPAEHDAGAHGRKHAKVAGRDRVQAKMSAFAFKSNTSAADALEGAAGDDSA
ncbi:DNA polymerase alpha accessory factor Mcl1 [Coemansia biformis]|uniref:DNA polymerase alpha accessory factor Mcl1 n=1 Tax=Coemansia biformis TaxID=1286918 RepID=A0A9W7YC54_9FUNG|nr:DNA polymerase alpha accessory factor Mcl1 [Coemansia biformis]